MDERAALRLESDTIGWLTTVGRGGRPQSSPVWFVWHSGAVHIASEPTAGKMANLVDNPWASFHLEGAGPGALVVTVEGIAAMGARLVGDVRERYATKYAAGLDRLGTTTSDYLSAFSASITLVPRRWRTFTGE